MMTGWTIWDSSRRRPQPVWLLLAGTLAICPGGAAWGAASAAARPADLDRALQKAGQVLDKAADAAEGRDPGRVSLLLRRADDELQRFETGSRLADLARRFEEARAAARAGRLPEAQTAVRGARDLVPPLYNFIVVRQAELDGRLAQQAAADGDAAACLQALDSYETAILPDILLRRVRETRDAVRTARDAMVRRDMKGGRVAIGTARRSLAGLRYAGALSRALFALRVGAELMREPALIAAKQQLQNAVRDLRSAVTIAPDAERDALTRVRDGARDIWGRMTRPREGDAASLEKLAGELEAIRARQS
jgi:hypothetical protein